MKSFENESASSGLFAKIMQPIRRKCVINEHKGYASTNHKPAKDFQTNRPLKFANFANFFEKRGAKNRKFSRKAAKSLK